MAAVVACFALALAGYSIYQMQQGRVKSTTVVQTGATPFNAFDPTQDIRTFLSQMQGNLLPGIQFEAKETLGENNIPAYAVRVKGSSKPPTTLYWLPANIVPS